MILLDFSALLHQCVFGAINAVNPQEDENGQFKTDDFIGPALGFMLSNIFDLETTFNKYMPTARDMVICLDDRTNWRKRELKSYKGSRKSNRERSRINYGEVFSATDEMVSALRENTPYRVIKANEAEGDDVILSICERFAPSERILIVSSDKDMIQATKYGPVKQYSLLTKHFINYNTKNEQSLDDWLLDHVVLGDAADEIPRVIDNTEFTDEFSNFLKSKNIELTPEQFWKLRDSTKDKLQNAFGGVMFKHSRFGPSTLRKEIKKFGSLDNWLDSNPLYRINYERNKKLILSEYIPGDIKNSIMIEFDHASTDFNELEFRGFLSKYHLDKMAFNLPQSFYHGGEIGVDAFL